MSRCLDGNGKAYIYRGEDKDINIRIAQKENGDPFDVTDASEIAVKFLNADGTTLSKLLSTSGVRLINAGGGRFSASLTAAETKLLALGSCSIEVVITISSKVTIAQIVSQLVITDRLFS